jgi:hypothetical protein
LKNPKAKQGWQSASSGRASPNKHEALTLNPSPTKKKKKKYFCESRNVKVFVIAQFTTLKNRKQFQYRFKLIPICYNQTKSSPSIKNDFNAVHSVGKLFKIYD